MTGEHGNPDARAGDLEIWKLENLAALVSELLFLVGFIEPIVDDRTAHRHRVERDWFSKLGRFAKVDGVAVVGQLRDGIARFVNLLVELLDAGQTASRDRLIGADDHSLEASFFVEWLEHRHRCHRRAVWVGDDALGDVIKSVRVYFGHHERNVWVHPECRRVVDDDRTGCGHLVGDFARGRTTSGEDDDVETGVVGRGGVLHGDGRITELNLLTRAARGCEKSHLIDRKISLEEQGANNATDLAGGTDNS